MISGRQVRLGSKDGQQSLECVNRGGIDHLDRELIPRDWKSNREGCL